MYEFQNDIILGSFGFIFRNKGPHHILKILRLLPSNFKYVHIGGVHPMGNDGFLKEIELQIHDYNLEKRVTITGFLEMDKLAEAFSKIDLGLYLVPPNTIFGSGSINQFFVHGVPVLASRGSSFVDISNAFDCIELIDDYMDYPAIAKKIEILLSDRQRIEQLKQNEKRFCEENTFEKFAVKSILKVPQTPARVERERERVIPLVPEDRRIAA